MKPILTSLALLLSVSMAPAAIVLNEIFVNPPGTDQGQEFFEIRSTTGGVESMAGLTLLVIEGDGTTPGVIDAAFSLNSFSTGTNGLFLWRDASSTISPTLDVATVLNVADFVPDLENGSNTFMIVSGFTGVVTNDIDSNDDGTVDNILWGSVIDAVGLIENDGPSNVAYAAGLGFTNLGPDGGFNADLMLRDSVTGQWLSGDVVGTNPGGPYTIDTALGRASFAATPGLAATPGSANFTIAAIPEPSRAVLLGLAGFGVLIRRRRA